MNVRSGFNVNWRYEPLPKGIDKSLALSPHELCIEITQANVFGRDYYAWCEYPKIDKQEFERVKREYERTKMG